MSRTIVLTGATSGIGEAAALALARRGHRIAFVARDRARAEALLGRLRAINPAGEHAWHEGDLTTIATMKSVGAAIAAAEPRIDVLVNNAGAVYIGRPRTIDGLAPSFALNHLAGFVLTLLLLPRLRATPGARIVCTSSRAHRFARFDPDRLQVDGLRGYSLSKLENILFVRELARRLGPAGPWANAFHPGFVASRFADETPWPWRTLMKWRKAASGLSVEEGARTLLLLADDASLAGVTGQYYAHERPARPTPDACNDEFALALWQISARLTGLDLAG